MSARRAFRILSVVEGCSLLLLLVIAMPLKYGLGIAVAVRIAGSLHGVLFLALLSTALQVLLEQSIPRARIACVVGLAFVPFGFISGDRILRRGG